jgi:Protein of unknown function (DUF3078)
MTSKRTFFVFAAVLAASDLLAIDAEAQPQVPGQYVAPPEDAPGRPDGVSPGLAVGATVNFSDNRSVVGQPDGSSLTVGSEIDASLDYNDRAHEWRSSLGSSAGVSRTPTLDEFVKTRDELRFETIYLYHLTEAAGLFARFALNTSMFEGSDLRATAADYAIARTDGTTQAIRGRRLKLTDPFQPLTLKQSLGGFVQPLTTDEIRLEARAGAGAQEVIADGQLALVDDAATADVVEVKELSSFNQLGVEAVANAWGALASQRLSYNVGIAAMVPLAHTALPAGDDRNSLELTNIEFSAGLSVKLFDWASLDYKLKVLRQPQLLDEVQVSNNLLLTIGLALGSKAPKEPPPPPCEPALPAPPAPPAPPAGSGATSPPPVSPEPVSPAPVSPPPVSPDPVSPPPAAPGVSP